MIFLSKYKWMLIASMWLASIAGASYVAWQLATRSAIQDQLTLATSVLDRKAQDEALQASISKTLQETLASLRPQITTINKEIQREIIQNNVYRDCKSTDGVVQQYERKLDLQSK